MVPRIAWFLMAGIAMANAELDLTPDPHQWEIEGVRVQDVAFHNGEKLVTYTPPPKWRLAGGGRQLRMTPPEVALSEGIVEVRTKPSPASFDEETVQKLKKELAGTLPKDAKDFEWIADEKNPLVMNQHETYRVTLNYVANVQRQTVTMITCNFAEYQLRFVLASRQSDFPKLYEEFRQSLFTWQGLE